MSSGDPRVDFRLEIVRQGWLVGDYQDAYDMCSHGAIRAVLGGTVVTDPEGDYGITQSALGLLRSIDGRLPATAAFGEFLLCHGCGYPFSNGCGSFGTDWAVELEGEHVILRNARHYGASLGLRMFDVEVRLPRQEYVGEVVRFAQTARDFYMAAEPRKVPEDELPFHQQFWREFDDRLDRNSRDIRDR